VRPPLPVPVVEVVAFREVAAAAAFPAVPYLAAGGRSRRSDRAAGRRLPSALASQDCPAGAAEACIRRKRRSTLPASHRHGPPRMGAFATSRAETASSVLLGDGRATGCGRSNHDLSGTHAAARSARLGDASSGGDRITCCRDAATARTGSPGLREGRRMRPAGARSSIGESI
jgi:hypothetical protein